MFKRNVVSLAVLTTLVATSAVAANKKSDQEDSVNSWGSWSGVQTAAGPGAGAAVPLLIQFANSQNNTDSSAFEAGTENDNAGYREYGVWRSRNQLGEAGVARADHDITRLKLKRRRADQLDFVVTNNVNDNTYSPRVLRGYYDEVTSSGHFDSSKRISNKNGSYRWNYQNYNVSGVITADESQPQPVFLFMLPPVDVSEEDIVFVQGNWNGYDNRYNKHGRYIGTRYNNEGAFIAGQTSTFDSVNNLLAGNVVAQYSGNFLMGRGAVDLTLNLGSNPSWTGTFNGTFGQNVGMDRKGIRVEFEVQDGTFNGVDLAGSVNDSGVTGVVDASFFGVNAEHINGIADVSHVKAGAMIDVFSTTVDGKTALKVGNMMPE